MEGLGKYVRHFIAAAIGAIVAFVVGQAAANGLDVNTDPAAYAGTVEAITGFVMLFVYAMLEKFLKRFPWLDLEGYAMRQQAKQAAGTVRATEAVEERLAARNGLR